MTKIQLFLDNTKLLQDVFDITPLLYGSLGLEYLTGCDLGSDDIDILIPKTYMTNRWSDFCAVLENDGYILTDEHEHTFEKNGVCYSYAQIEELADFAKINIGDIKTHTCDDVNFLLLSLGQYLKVYLSSVKDGYRIDVRGKKDREKINFIREQLKNTPCTIEPLDPADYEKCGNIWDMSAQPLADKWKQEILTGNRRVYMYIINGEFIGEGALVFDTGDPDYTLPHKRVYVSRMIVKEEYQNLGIGGKLLKHLENEAKTLGFSQMSIGVDKDNLPALHLYKKYDLTDVIFDGEDEFGPYYKLLKHIK